MPRQLSFDSDHVGSDDLEEILEMSRNNASTVASSRNTSTSARASQPSTSNGSSHARRQELDAQLDSLDAEIGSVDSEMAKLTTLRAQLVRQKNEVLKQIEHTSSTRPIVSNALDTSSKEKAKAVGIDYSEDWDWSPDLKARMQRVFQIQDFRLVQKGVCNANMDRRDIVCIMPTGGGKSLTYQLPALLSTGCTIVISPLISLITDQILHLREAGVEAVMLTGGTGKEDSRSIMSRLTSWTPQSADKEIKLCYVTPEKIAKSKGFVSIMEKLANKGRLARIVVDEAHCVSQLGHDFRPDYKKLSILRQLFPRVPIMALSATCPPKVLEDVLKILRLPPITDGSAADRSGTVHFAAPLYRKNLHYKIMPKPTAAAAAIQAMADYIIASHSEQSGIIYCLSKKDTEAVAVGLSERGIRTGVYHADIGDGEKERLHVRWREGKVKVVCATIAFGLGIDKGDVRFVLHHTMSKSLEGYYQESGRAGRDGKDSDCVLFYRGQDATRLSSLVAGEPDGKNKVHAMLKYAQDLKGCRKLLFANYFSASSSLSLSAWGASTDAGERCGHCDNCSRDPDSISADVDVTLDAWRILRILKHVTDHDGRVTIAILADLVRGAGGGSFTAGKKGKGAQKDKMDLDLEDLCGGKVTLPKDDIETLIIQLFVTNYLEEDYSSNAYAVNVYARLGSESYRLLRRTQVEIEQSGGLRLRCDFVKSVKPAKKSRKSTAAAAPRRVSGKRKRSNGSDEAELFDLDGVGSDTEDERPAPAPIKPKAPSVVATSRKPGPGADTSKNLPTDEHLNDVNGDGGRRSLQHRRTPPNRTMPDSSDIDDDWEVPGPRSIKKRKVAPPPDDDDSDVIVLPS